ncbi:hypothetical protein [Parapedobacter sp. 2B3]|uniref:hypothetical protein n=1 Tax=Parapedobacter sp. 2B3 TaxID=3342381 RepID=UPI0035B57076
MKALSIRFVNARFRAAWGVALFAMFSCSCEKDPATPGLGSNVERISLLLDYEAGYGGYVYPVHNPYVFFKDGRYVKEPKIPVNELNLDALTTEQAVNWGTWKRSGSDVILTNRDGDDSEKEWPGAQAFAAKKGESLSGAFGSISGGGNLAVGGTVGVISYSSMTFTPDGWFTNEKLGGGTNSDHSAFSRQTSAGRYELDGYTITLNFNNGDTKRFFFCYYGEDKQVFRLSGRTYTN